MNEPAKLVKPENKLKKKVGNGGFKAEHIAKAQNMIENNTIDFKPIALDLLKEAAGVIAEIRRGTVGHEEGLGRVLYPLMQLRAQGALFHYPSITAVSDIVVDFMDGNKKIDSDVLDILDGYHKATAAMLKLDIKQADHKVGKALCGELMAACQRYKKQSAPE